MAYTYKYPRPAVTADCVVMTREAEPKVLLIQRGEEPFKGAWAFPGGFMNMEETTELCAIRELEEETGLHLSDVHQIGAYSKVDRDPRGRTITVAYLAIIDEPVAVKVPEIGALRFGHEQRIRADGDHAAFGGTEVTVNARGDVFERFFEELLSFGNVIYLFGFVVKFHKINSSLSD